MNNFFIGDFSHLTKKNNAACNYLKQLQRGRELGDIEDKILEGLKAEDKEVMDSYGKELGMFGLIAESFTGKLKAAVIAVILLILNG